MLFSLIFLSYISKSSIFAAEPANPASNFNVGKKYTLQKDASIWQPQDVGFSYKNCEWPSFLQADACERRLSYPSSGDSIRVVEPIKKIPDGRKFALIKIRGKYGWIDTDYIENDRKSIKKNAYLYQEPGFDYNSCSKLPLPSGCIDRQYIKKGQVIEEFAPTQTQMDDKTYVMSEFQNNETTVMGWIETDRFAVPLDTTIASGTQAVQPCTKCMDNAESELVSTKTREVMEATIKSVDEAIPEAKPLDGFKSRNEMEKFACIHSKDAIYGDADKFTHKKFCDHYVGRKPNFVDQAAKAAKAYNIPENLLMCVLMVENGLHFDGVSEAGARGYAQFTPIAVRELKDQIKKPEYREMWKRYSSRPFEHISTRTYIMDKADVEIAVGAAAFLLHRNMNGYIPFYGCKGCSFNTQKPNRKDIYMAIAAYNSGTMVLPKIKNQSVDQLKNTKLSPPPEKETRNYFHQVDNCLKPGEFDDFKGAGDDNTFKNRADKCVGSCR